LGKINWEKQLENLIIDQKMLQETPISHVECSGSFPNQEISNFSSFFIFFSFFRNTKSCVRLKNFLDHFQIRKVLQDRGGETQNSIECSGSFPKMESFFSFSGSREWTLKSVQKKRIPPGRLSQKGNFQIWKVLQVILECSRIFPFQENPSSFGEKKKRKEKPFFSNFSHQQSKNRNISFSGRCCRIIMEPSRTFPFREIPPCSQSRNAPPPGFNFQISETFLAQKGNTTFPKKGNITFPKKEIKGDL